MTLKRSEEAQALAGRSNLKAFVEQSKRFKPMSLYSETFVDGDSPLDASLGYMSIDTSTSSSLYSSAETTRATSPMSAYDKSASVAASMKALADAQMLAAYMDQDKAVTYSNSKGVNNRPCVWNEEGCNHWPAVATAIANGTPEESMDSSSTCASSLPWMLQHEPGMVSVPTPLDMPLARGPSLKARAQMFVIANTPPEFEHVNNVKALLAMQPIGQQMNKQKHGFKRSNKVWTQPNDPIVMRSL